jgi:hypothetical protein
VAVSGCTVGSSGRDAGGNADMGAVPDTGAPDTGPTTCANDSQCNDGFACTIDMCAVGAMCQHTPIDGMCPSGQRCVVGTGCTAGMMGMPCTTAADCDDHVFCNGVEQCLLHECAVAMAPHNCDDGNSCTTEVCDSTSDMCVYTTVCDSGVHGDSGPVCTPFDPATDFNGSYSIYPRFSQACGGATYDVSVLTLSVSGSIIHVSTGLVGSILMTGTVTGNSFTASGTFGSGMFTLTGSFTCREQFTGHWMSTVSGLSCTNENADVIATRR